MPAAPHNAERTVARRGFTLTELMVVTTLIGVMAAISVPSFQRAIEQSRADIAVANLRTIWAAQRLYWLEKHTYASQLSDESATTPGPIQLGLLDASLPLDAGHATNQQGGYYYEVLASSFTATTFEARAVNTCSGALNWIQINQDGVVTTDPPNTTLTFQ
jgi:prepilin-type N-terminal cleavage/methylation domain-containing protein